MIVINITPFAG